MLGVTPAAANLAATESDKKGAATRMQTFTLQGVERFHQRQAVLGLGNAQGLRLDSGKSRLLMAEPC